ncbi:integrase core domain-containing protein, partial [Xanthomonas hortorum]|uniref:integrase core domain-containing protein n=1 Tax=Xanthomonas hortorum TaxID=56454 RepID=UPI001F3F5C2F
SRLELHGIDTHHATSLASGDSSIHPARRRSCDRRLMVRANQEEFCGKAMVAWAHARGVQLRLIQPGKPNQNAYVESFNGRLRD